MHFQWQSPNTTVTRPVDRLWRLLACTTRLDGRYTSKLKSATTPYFAPTTQKWGSVHFQRECAWPNV